MASERDRLEALYTFARGQELADTPVQGQFDAAHLREINRRLFQDLPGLGYSDVTPGEYRTPVEGNHDWYKARALEGYAERSIVAYSRMDAGARGEIDQTLQAADPARLSQLNTADFTETVADLYKRLDYLHPFPDGNSRTLRAFTRQLAGESGFDLDWSRFNASEGGRNVLYAARDLSVNRLALDHISTEDTRRHVMLTLDQFEGNRNLPDLLKDAVRPHRAIAFAKLDEADALAVFPELEPAYRTLRAAVSHSLAQMPDSADQRQQFQAAVQDKIQSRLDAGETIQYKTSAVARDRSASDKGLER